MPLTRSRSVPEIPLSELSHQTRSTTTFPLRNTSVSGLEERGTSDDSSHLLSRTVGEREHIIPQVQVPLPQPSGATSDTSTTSHSPWAFTTNPTPSFDGLDYGTPFTAMSSNSQSYFPDFDHGTSQATHVDAWSGQQTMPVFTTSTLTYPTPNFTASTEVHNEHMMAVPYHYHQQYAPGGDVSTSLPSYTPVSSSDCPGPYYNHQTHPGAGNE